MVIFHSFKAFLIDTLPLAPFLLNLCGHTQVLLTKAPFLQRFTLFLHFAEKMSFHRR